MHIEPFQLWIDIIEEYTDRRLTHYSDRLVAVAALANQLARAFYQMGKYVSGLFQVSLPLHLLWSRKASTLAKCRPARPVAPSWSWASIDEAVEWVAPAWGADSADIRDYTIHEAAKISIESERGDRLGLTLGLELTLFTPTLPTLVAEGAVLKYGQCLLTVVQLSTRKSVEICFTPDVCLVELIKDDDLHVTRAKLTVFHARDSKSGDREPTFCSSLVLLQQMTSPITYIRIGISKGDLPASWYDGLPDQEITVV